MAFAPRSLKRTSNKQLFLLLLVAFCIATVYLFRNDAEQAMRDLRSTGHIDPESLNTLGGLMRAQRAEMSRLRQTLDKLNLKIDAKTSDQLSAQTRKSIERNIDFGHSVEHESFWAQAPPKVWDNKRQEWEDYVNYTMPAWSAHKDSFRGRGIVLVGGNSDTLDRIRTTLSMLKEYGCTLPVEVHYLEGELNAADLKNLTAAGVKPLNLSDKKNLFSVKKKAGKGGKSFHIKTAAIINSGFKEVLYLDSDSMPVRDPTYLFDSEDYQRTGTMFFPDFWKTHFTNPIWQIVDSPIVDEWENESGQILLDKEKRWQVLLLANHFNRDGDFYFQLLNGDKDTLRFASKALRQEYYMVPTFLTAGGLIWQDRFCGHTMVQHDHEDQVMFIHANLIKDFTDEELSAEHEDGIFRVYKQYTATKGNTWLKPYFAGMGAVPCMELGVGQGEPDIDEDKFDKLVPDWNAFYKKHGGTGGGLK